MSSSTDDFLGDVYSDTASSDGAKDEGNKGTLKDFENSEKTEKNEILEHEKLEEEEADKEKDNGKRKMKRKHYSKLEDDVILKNVKEGNQNWKDISDILDNKRTAKSINHRYRYYLDDQYDNSPWDKEQTILLCMLVKKFGTDWGTIQKFFPKRNVANIKNRFKSVFKYSRYDKKVLVERGKISREATRFGGKEIRKSERTQIILDYTARIQQENLTIQGIFNTK